MATTGFLVDYQRKILEELAAGDGARAALAKAALERFADGSYGYCTRCGLRMPAVRLERWPERPHCLRCDDT